MTDSKNATICITVCTRERPNMLNKLLESCEKLEIPNNTEVFFIVVENDQNKTCEQLVDSKRPSSRFIYGWEPRLGIPIARNKCIEIALENKATHIAFIDDDEWLPNNWLTSIWEYYLTQAPETVIQGPVKPIFPEKTPEHFKHFFQPKTKPTGTRLHMCATNNVLVPASLFTDNNLRFDESRPLAGGTDSKLFRQAKDLGTELIYFSGAFVYEEVPRARISYKWLSKRHFRIGLTIGEHKHLKGNKQLIVHCTSKLSDSIWRALKSVFYLAKGNKNKHMKSWIKTCRAAGELLGPFGVTIDSYKKIEGN